MGQEWLNELRCGTSTCPAYACYFRSKRTFIPSSFPGYKLFPAQSRTSAYWTSRLCQRALSQGHQSFLSRLNSTDYIEPGAHSTRPYVPVGNWGFHTVCGPGNRLLPSFGNRTRERWLSRNRLAELVRTWIGNALLKSESTDLAGINWPSSVEVWKATPVCTSWGPALNPFLLCVQHLCNAY